MAEYVGFYWTRPVNWAGFRRLPKNVEQAAKLSKTIRYQCERVRRWVEDENGTVAGEFVFIERDPDEATTAIRDELGKALTLCRTRRCSFVYVDFGHVKLWRRHRYMWEMLRESGVPIINLEPHGLTIDGKWFDPIGHFERWRENEAHWRGEHRNEVLQAVADALKAIPAGRGRYKAIAAYLSERGMTTIMGREWDEDNVRKFLE
ncbi:hypothetical protein NKH64_14845 [Mesorhizobium sp. M0999]|uniref:hypothetical protein n=1 Tax=Mesorhizobium sp. M0999 TaxID=2957045 RepID=UPI0033353CB0